MSVGTFFKKFVLFLVLAILCVSCGSVEKKRMKFYNRGMELYEAGDYVRALLEFKNVIQIDPEYSDAYYMAGMTALKEKEFIKAFGYFKNTVDRNPRHDKSHRRLALLYIEADALGKAAGEVDLLLAHDPADQDNLILKARLLLALGKTGESLELLESLQFSATPPREYYVALHKALTKAGEKEKIEAMLGAAIGAYPREIPFRVLAVGHYADARRYPEAEAMMKAIIELDPETLVNKMTLASIYWQAGKKDEVGDYFAELTAEDRENEELWIEIARFYAKEQEPELVEKTLDQAIAENQRSFALYFEKKNFLLAAKRTAEAVELLKKCLTLDRDPAAPGIMDAHLALAGISLTAGENDEAEQHVDAVLEQNSRSVEGNFLKGQLNLGRGEAESAVANFNLVVNERPDWTRAALFLAQALSANNQPELALDSLQQAQQKNPNDPDLLLALARLYNMNQDFEQAEKKLVKLSGLDRKNPQYQRHLADFYLAGKRYEEAENIYRSLTGKTPAAPEPWISLAALYQKWQKPEAVLASAREAYQLNPDSSFFLEHLVRTLLKARQYEEAEKECRKWLVRRGDDAVAYVLLGEINTVESKFAAAEGLFIRAAALAPGWQAPRTNLASLYLLQGKEQEAIDKLKETIAADPKNGEAYASLGTIYMKRQEIGKARDLYRRALVEIPDHFNAANNLAYILSDFYDNPAMHEEALRYAQLANTLDPASSLAMDTLGMVYYKLGNLAEARKYLVKGLDLTPDLPVLNYHLGMVLYAGGDIAGAREKLEKAVNHASGFSGKNKAVELLNKIS